MRAFSIEPTDEGVLITAPSAHRPAHLLIGVPLVLYLVFMAPAAAVWVNASADVVRVLGPLAGIPAGALVFLAGMALTFAPGLAGVFLIAYEYRGVERVRADERRLRISHAVGRFAWPRRYDMRRVRSLEPSVGAPPATRWAPATGGISFQYGRRCVRFATALDESEARRVADALGPYLGSDEGDEEARDGE